MSKDEKAVLHSFPNGLTVAALKVLLKDWPETDKEGTPNEVWVYDEHAGFSWLVVNVYPLNSNKDIALGFNR